MNVPDDLRYTAEHEWARLDGNLLKIGVTGNKSFSRENVLRSLQN